MKTSELTGAVLDWAVAKCEGLPLKLDPMGFRKDAPTSMQAGWWVWGGEGQNQVIGHRKTRRGEEDGYSPSTNWAQGGPIIEREHIDIRHTFTQGGYRTSESVDACHASINLPNGSTVFGAERAVWEYGPTPLIAAMRCYVASKLGDEVEVPDELA